jgi:hypothetical protein
LKGDYWIVRDTVISARDHRVDLSFHFDSAPGVVDALDVRCFGSDRGVEEEAFVSHCYGLKEAAPALRFSTTLPTGGGDIVTFLLPRSHGSEWRVNQSDMQDGREFEVFRGNNRDTVIIPTSGAWIWERTIAGEVSERLCAALTE